MKRQGRRGRALGIVGCEEDLLDDVTQRNLLEGAGIPMDVLQDMSNEERMGTLKAILESSPMLRKMVPVKEKLEEFIPARDKGASPQLSEDSGQEGQRSADAEGSDILMSDTDKSSNEAQSPGDTVPETQGFDSSLDAQSNESKPEYNSKVYIEDQSNKLEKVLIQRQEQSKFMLSLYSPRYLIDPDRYTQVIQLVFDIYLRQVARAQKMMKGPMAAWGRPVKSGRNVEGCLVMQDKLVKDRGRGRTSQLQKRKKTENYAARKQKETEEADDNDFVLEEAGGRHGINDTGKPHNTKSHPQEPSTIKIRSYQFLAKDDKYHGSSDDTSQSDSDELIPKGKKGKFESHEGEKKTKVTQGIFGELNSKKRRLRDANKMPSPREFGRNLEKNDKKKRKTFELSSQQLEQTCSQSEFENMLRGVEEPLGQKFVFSEEKKNNSPSAIVNSGQSDIQQDTQQQSLYTQQWDCLHLDMDEVKNIGRSNELNTLAEACSKGSKYEKIDVDVNSSDLPECANDGCNHGGALYGDVRPDVSNDKDSKQTGISGSQSSESLLDVHGNLYSTQVSAGTKSHGHVIVSESFQKCQRIMRSSRSLHSSKLFGEKGVEVLENTKVNHSPLVVSTLNDGPSGEDDSDVDKCSKEQLEDVLFMKEKINVNLCDNEACSKITEGFASTRKRSWMPGSDADKAFKDTSQKRKRMNKLLKPTSTKTVTIASSIDLTVDHVAEEAQKCEVSPATSNEQIVIQSEIGTSQRNDVSESCSRKENLPVIDLNQSGGLPETHNRQRFVIPPEASRRLRSLLKASRNQKESLVETTSRQNEGLQETVSSQTDSKSEISSIQKESLPEWFSSKSEISSIQKESLPEWFSTQTQVLPETKGKKRKLQGSKNRQGVGLLETSSRDGPALATNSTQSDCLTLETSSSSKQTEDVPPEADRTQTRGLAENVSVSLITQQAQGINHDERARQFDSTCPICGKYFHLRKLTAHASTCGEGASQDTDQEDKNRLPVPPEMLKTHQAACLLTLKSSKRVTRSNRDLQDTESYSSLDMARHGELK